MRCACQTWSGSQGRGDVWTCAPARTCVAAGRCACHHETSAECERKLEFADIVESVVEICFRGFGSGRGPHAEGAPCGYGQWYKRKFGEVGAAWENGKRTRRGCRGAARAGCMGRRGTKRCGRTRARGDGGREERARGCDGRCGCAVDAVSIEKNKFGESAALDSN